MKILSTILTFCVVFYFSTPVQAQQQDNQLVLTIVHHVKPDKMDDYLNVFKELKVTCKEHNYPFSYFVWQSTFPDFYMFFPIENYNSIKDINNEIWKIIPTMGEGYGRKLMTTIESWDQFFMSRIDTLSYNPEINPEGMVYAEWWIRYQDTWTGLQHRRAFKHTIEKIKNSEAEYPIGRFQADVGMNGPAIITVFWGKNRADLASYRSKTWEILGDEGQKMINDLAPITRKIEMIPFWYSEELSYRAQ